MYICRDCGEIFTEDELEEEDCSFYTEYWGSNILVPYTNYKCPYCGSKDFVDACRCEDCGEWCVPDDDGLCDECSLKSPDEHDKELVAKVLNRVKKELDGDYNQYRINYILDKIVNEVDDE